MILGPKVVEWTCSLWKTRFSQVFVGDSELVRIHPKHDSRIYVVDWTRSLRKNKKSFWPHELKHQLHIDTPFSQLFLCNSEMVRNHPKLFPRIMFWVGFGPVRYRQGTLVKIGYQYAINPWVCVAEMISGFSQWTSPFHYFWSYNHVLGGSGPFRCGTETIAKIGYQCAINAWLCVVKT